MTDGLERLLIQETIDSHRHLRHDFMNDIQVITGYLQIGQVEKAHAYCKNAAANLEIFQSLSKIKLPYLESFFLCYMTLLNSARDLLQITIKEDLSSWWEEDRNLTGLFRELLVICREDMLDKKVEFWLQYVQPMIMDVLVRYFDKIPAEKTAKIAISVRQNHFANLEVTITETTDEEIRIRIKKNI